VPAVVKQAQPVFSAILFCVGEDITDSFNPASFSRLTFIQNNSNTGFAGGINIALRSLQNVDAYVWLLNPDMVVTENTLG
jgi:GT2 family glycosyltransferase